jgi:hypothetical protein
MIVSLVASTFSIGLAIFAIWQAWVFSRSSSASSQEATRAADAVGEGVRKVEGLVDHLYTDMFQLMRETVGDMRKHAWHEPPSSEVAGSSETRKLASHDAAHARREAAADIRIAAERAGANEQQVRELENAFRRTLERSISSFLQAERAAAQAAIREQLTTAIDYERRCRDRTMIRADDLLNPLFEKFDPEDVHRVLASMKKNGAVDWDGDSDWVEWPEVMVYLTPGHTAPEHRSGLALAG